MAQTLVLISLVKPFNLNIYFCEKCQKAQKLLVERQFFKQINPLLRESLRPTTRVKPKFGLDLVLITVSQRFLHHEKV